MAKVDVPAPGGTFAGATTERGRTPGGRFTGDGISGFVQASLSESILWIGPNPPNGDQYVLWINTEDGRWYGRWDDGDSIQWVDLSLPFGEGLPGPRGPQGERGVIGATGQGLPIGGATNEILVKIDGTDYNTTWGVRPADGLNVLNGIVAPTTEGVDGEFYIDTVLSDIYGPKAAGVWGSATSLVGPTGLTGADGSTILNGIIAPTTEGVDGDFYIDTVLDNIYGPKAAGVWGSATSMIGPQGPTGANGETLLNGIVAPTTEGDNGDFYIDTVLNLIHGPKAAGVWPAGVDMIGEGVPAGGTINQHLTKVNSTDYNTQWVDAPDLSYPARHEITGTTYTFVAADEGRWKFTSNAASVTLTIDASVFAVGDEVYIKQEAAGLITFAPFAGTTIDSRGSLLSSGGDNAVMGFKVESSSLVTLFGDIA